VIAFDTNVYIYSTDKGAGDKHARSAELIGAATKRLRLFIPIQTLGEFYWVATRKIGHSPAAARGYVEAWAEGARRVVSYDLADLGAAMEASAKHAIPAWDALIWAVCERCGVETLVTEDFQNGRTLGRVTFLNPFGPANDARLGLDSA
jgi:predicted nucleic acid-binding protein